MYVHYYNVLVLVFTSSDFTWLMPWLYFFFKLSLQVFVKMDCTNHEGLRAATDLIRLDKRHLYSMQFKFWVSRDPQRPTPPLYMIVRIFKHHPICNDLGVSPEMRVSQINFKGKQKSEASQDALLH